jgi:hypothetical protein
MNYEKVADKIVETLFTNGAGQKADRLVLELPGSKDGGGWCRAAARDRIVKILEANGQSADAGKEK